MNVYNTMRQPKSLNEDIATSVGDTTEYNEPNDNEDDNKNHIHTFSTDKKLHTICHMVFRRRKTLESPTKGR